MFLLTPLSKLIVLFKGNNLKISNILYEQILLDLMALKNIFCECILFFIQILQFKFFLAFSLLFLSLFYFPELYFFSCF